MSGPVLTPADLEVRPLRLDIQGEKMRTVMSQEVFLPMKDTGFLLRA